MITAIDYLNATRAHGGNPNHKGSGPGGGQFAAGAGTGHGKHWAKRQRRKQKLAKAKSAGEKKLGELSAKHASERKALRAKHRESSTSYSDRHKETAKLRDKHQAERQGTAAKVKADIAKAVPPRTGKGKSESRQKLEKARQEGHAKIADQRATHRKEQIDVLKEHAGERRAQRKEHVKEHKSLRAEQKGEYKDLAQEKKQEHRDEMKDLLKSQHREEAQTAEHGWEIAKVHARAQDEAVKVRDVAAFDKAVAAGDEHSKQQMERLNKLAETHEKQRAVLTTENTRIAKRDLAELHDQHHEQAQDLKTQHRGERRELGGQHAVHQSDVLTAQRKERRQLIAHLKGQLHAQFPKRKNGTATQQKEARVLVDALAVLRSIKGELAKRAG